MKKRWYKQCLESALESNYTLEHEAAGYDLLLDSKNEDIARLENIIISREEIIKHLRQTIKRNHSLDIEGDAE